MNKREALIAMLNGEKVVNTGWNNGLNEYIFIDEYGNMKDNDNNMYNDFHNCIFSTWKIYEEPKIKTVTITRPEWIKQGNRIITAIDWYPTRDEWLLNSIYVDCLISREWLTKTIEIEE